MKKTKTILAALLLVALTITSCKKEAGPKGDTGAQGPAGTNGAQGVPGPSAKTFTFTGTFGASTQFISYTGLVGSFDVDDIVLTYILNATYGGNDYYVALPWTDGGVNYYVEINENTGFMYVNTDKASGAAGSPWASTVTLKFKAVLIKSSQRLLHPDLNYKNYKEVAKAFNIKD